MAGKKVQSSKLKVQSSEIVIQFVGKRREIDKKTGREKLVLREAPTVRVNGNKTFNLPPDEEQKKGFTHEEAKLLLKLYRQDFKIKSPKGKKVK